MRRLLFTLALLVATPVQALDREAVYARMLDFKSLVKDGPVTPHWTADGRRFWYERGGRKIMVDAATGRSEPAAEVPAEPMPGRRAAPAEPVSYHYGSREVPAPSGPWWAIMKDNDLWLRSDVDGRATPLTTDGADRFAWSLRANSWSPDGQRLFVTKVDWRDVRFTPIVHWLKPNREEVVWSPAPQAGGALDRTELHVLDVFGRADVRIDTGPDQGARIWPVGWRPDGSEVLYLRTDRLEKRLDLMAADPRTGASRVLVSDRQDTFVERIIPITDSLYVPFADGSKFIWRSERDGFSHLYLYDRGGKLLRRLTEGAAPVERVVAIDEARGWVYYLASGDPARPYDVQLWRVDMLGRNRKLLTDGPGVHTVSLSPTLDYIVDSWSTVDQPRRQVLRRADGTVVKDLARADISALMELGWRPPEEFRVKAADGVTDLYGVLYKPFDFDPAKSWPVVDLEYPGNFTHQAPRAFVGTWLGDEAQALAQLGFIVVIVDGRGTTGRGKTFQDFTYRGVGRVEVPDHVATLKQLAADRPWMDMNRVGITGYSWGGWMAIRGLLTAPEVYKVAVAGAPVVDVYGEAYLGLPPQDQAQYDFASNLPLAGRLEGKLLMTTGTSDPGAPFGSAMRMADAFIKAGKHFDLIVFPGEAHQLSASAQAYYLDARNRYLQQHLRAGD